jgi:capsular polysaccharide export protein
VKQSLRDDIEGELKLVYALTPLSLCYSSKPSDEIPQERVDQMTVAYRGMKTLREPQLDTPVWRERIRRRATQWYRMFLNQLSDVDLLVIWSGFAVPLAAAAAAVQQLGRHVAFCENGVLPGTIAIDLAGVNYRCSLTGKDADFYRSFPYDDAEAEKLFTTVWPQRPLRVAKPQGQHVGSDESQSLPERYILYAMQVNDDSQIRMFSPRFRHMEESVTYVRGQLEEYNRRANDSLKLVVKEHPSDYGRVDYTRLRESMPDVTFLRAAPIRDLIKGAQALMTINSSVAVEALFSDIPVVTLGQAFYNVDGLVRHLEADEELADILPSTLSEPLDSELRKHFLCFLWQRHLVPHPDKHPGGATRAAERIARLLEEAEQKCANSAHISCGSARGCRPARKASGVTDDIPCHTLGLPVLTEPRRIACFHLNQIGDLLFSLPALQNLRARYPEAHIAGIVRPACRDLLLLSGLVDEVIERPGGSFAHSVRLGMQIRRRSFDLMLLFSTSHSAWMVAQMSGSKVKAGFTDGVFRPGIQQRVPWSPPPSTESNLRLIEAIGCPVVKRDYVGLIRPGESELSQAHELLDSIGAGDRIAVLSPGASKGREIKRWPDECCAAVADALKEQFGLTPVIVGMKGDADGVMGISRHARDITGRTSLPVLAGVLARAKLLIGADSGVMHLSGAVGTPVVALFGPTDHTMTGPQGDHRIVRLGLDCAPCQASTCAIGYRCMTEITPGMVLEAVSDLIGNSE